MNLVEGKRSGAVSRTVLLFLCAVVSGNGAVEGGKGEWRIVRKDPPSGEVELEFKGNEKPEEFTLLGESRSRAVLSYVSAGGAGARRRVIVKPVAARKDRPSPALVGARSGNEISTFKVGFPVPKGYRLYAVPPVRKSSFRVVRKKAFGLGQEKEYVLRGGIAQRPDALARHGVFGDPGPHGADFPPSRGTAAFPAVFPAGKEIFFAWTVYSGAGKSEVWITRAGGRAKRLAQSGRFPQLAGAGERIYCVWRLQDAAFLCVSGDRGKTWGEPRLIARSSGLRHLSAAARGEAVLILWRDSRGLSWRLSRDGGANFSLGGELKGPYVRPRGGIGPEGDPLVVALRKGGAGAEAVLTVCDREGRPQRTSVLLSGPPLAEAAFRVGERGNSFVFLVDTDAGRRIAHLSPEGDAYLLPPPPGPPFGLDVEFREGKLRVSFLVPRKGAVELFAFESDDEGLTWQGPVRILSGRSLCTVKAEVLVGWEGALGGETVLVNGKPALVFPSHVPTGRARLPLEVGVCSPAGWVEDRVKSTCSGKVDVTILLYVPVSERAAYGLNQAHAEGLSERSPPPPCSDLALLAEGITAEKLTGRCGTELPLELGLRNLGVCPSPASTVRVFVDGEERANRRFGALSEGEERNVSVRLPLPEKPGPHRLRFLVDCGRDGDFSDNELFFPLSVRPLEDVVLHSPGEFRIELPAGQRLRLVCRRGSFLTLRPVAEGVTRPPALLISGKEKRDVDLSRPLSLEPGEYVLLLAPGKRKTSFIVSFREKTDPQEPNDTPDLASSLRLPVELLCSLRPAGDRDWFRVVLPEDGHLLLSAAEVPSGADIALSVRAPGGRWIAEERSPPLSLYLRRGRYEILLAERWGTPVSREFRLRVDLVRGEDKNEPNDFITQARLLKPGDVFETALFPLGDEDWFRFRSPGRGYFDLTFPPEEKKRPPIRFSLFDSASRPVARPGEPPARVRLGKGEYYLRLRSAAAFRKPVRLLFGFTPEFDPHEPNDDIDRARKISLPSRFEIALWPRGDRDWFSFRGREKGYVRVSLPEGSPGSLKVGVSLWRGEALVVPLKVLPASFRVEPGEYALEFRTLGGEAAEDLFPVELSFEPEMDPTEDNDQPESAFVLSCPGSVDFALWPPEDVDWFRIKVPAKGDLAVSVAGGDPDLRLEFLFGGGAGGNRVEFGRSALFAVEGGEKLLRVRAASRPAEPVKLTLTVRLRTEGKRENGGKGRVGRKDE